jgi:hypothetical protein
MRESEETVGHGDRDRQTLELRNSCSFICRHCALQEPLQVLGADIALLRTAVLSAGIALFSRHFSSWNSSSFYLRALRSSGTGAGG